MRERESPERDAKREPISLQIAAADSPQVPRVSIAMGANITFPSWDSREYLARLFLSACAAAEPAAVAEEATCEGANVSGQVKSQISGLPWLQGSSVAPSGRFLPSSLSRERGSSSTCTSTERIARARTSLACACLRWRPALRLQERPWSPLDSTSTPQPQVWGRTRGAPRRRPRATLSSLLLRQRPRFLHGSTWSQAPASGDATAKSRAREVRSAL